MIQSHTDSGENIKIILDTYIVKFNILGDNDSISKIDYKSNEQIKSCMM